MCTYNGARYLPQQLESLVSQSRRPDQLIVCDDRSSDDTLRLLEAFAAGSPFPVRVIANEERLGPAKNFEKAISLCDGSIIMLSDQDDIWKSHKIETLAHAFAEYPDAVYAFSDGDMIDENGALLGETVWTAVGINKVIGDFAGVGQLDVLLRHNLISGAAMAIRSWFRGIILPIPRGWMHDYWIVLLGSALYSGVPVAETLWMYRRHTMQTCGWRKKTYIEVFRDSLKTEPGEWTGKVDNFQKLFERLELVSESHPCAPDRLRRLDDKARHLSRRAAIRSSSRSARIVKVLSEALTGRYQRFSDSWQSIIRDIV